MNTTILPAWRNVERAITVEGRYTYGDVIPYHELHELIGLEELGSDARADAADQWRLRRLKELDALRKHMLVEHQMLLETEASVGLRIVLPCDQTASSELKFRRELTKALRDHRDRITYVDCSQLTAEQRKENVDAQVRLAARTHALRSIEHTRLLRLPKQASDTKK